MSQPIPSICITSVGARTRYLPYLDRLETSLRKWNPNIPRLFYRNVWPPGSPSHEQSHYFFKQFAMSAVFRAGFDIGIWLDSACEVLADLAPILVEIEREGFYIVAGGEPLGEWISDQALDHFGVTRDQAMDLKLCGGAIVGIDFRKPNVLGYEFLREWHSLGRKGLFYTSHSDFAPDRMTSLQYSDGPKREVISKDPRCLGHRADEACFSLMLRARGLEPFNIGTHFTRREAANTRAVIKTGYDGEWEHAAEKEKGLA